jgi:hypothetical protein
MSDNMKSNASKNHRKKRNSLLVYEFLVRTVSSALIDGNQKLSDDVLRIIKKHYKPGSELFKEFRLANSLLNSKVSSTTAAHAIISEARTATKLHNVSMLEREKSLLIRDINHIINDSTFWDRPVPDYMARATIGTLLEDWRRKDGATLDRMASYEEKLQNILQSERDSKSTDTNNNVITTPGESRFMLRVMTRKLNERYGNTFSEEQKSLLKEHIYGSIKGKDASTLKPKLDEIRTNVLNAITANPIDGEYMMKQLQEIKSNLIAEDTSKVDDALITRFMLYMKLVDELKSNDEGGNNG